MSDDPILGELVVDKIGPLQERVDAMQAQIDTGVPRCFTECRVVRDRNRVEEQRDKCKLRITKLEEDLAKAQKALDDELAVLQRHEDKLQKLNTKIEELS
eukprot:3502024-Pyramimonas_sp.AAC.1